MAQPALSARMRRLEAELGAALLVRSTRSVVLTTAGAALAESAPPALGRAWDTARSAAAGELGTLRMISLRHSRIAYRRAAVSEGSSPKRSR
ncbi:LysR family transcriptional regulator [Nocardia sp. NBC_01499]|uniref:LysR family transcriptional regulator n=1 Tax=Nocardia sp. NBC_01499 TaxID=2903597 RepID=UPI00386EAF29